MRHQWALRDRFALALDRDDAVEAQRLASTLQPWFGVAKVGLELFTAAGPAVVATLADAGFRVFADLKLHDIPTTVYRAARVLGSLGVELATLHAVGGRAMLRAGVEGLVEGADRSGASTPIALGVVSLTSQPALPHDVLVARVEDVVAAGCQGVVVGGDHLALVSERWPDLLRVVPGIRSLRGGHHDQRQVLTVQEAFRRGADVVVVGRAVTEASDPAAVAATLLREADLARGEQDSSESRPR